MTDVKTENTVKRLEATLQKAENPDVKKELQAKINALKGSKIVQK